ncbi:hypothetical protein DGWBC_1050 [Dehalogenimonas sp. WBC-2]|nr:hypothetical protein DGWBC_1050 [Dehalogenimonas sp. WBC-2]
MFIHHEVIISQGILNCQSLVSTLRKCELKVGRYTTVKIGVNLVKIR